jgi:hypothetical protein
VILRLEMDLAVNPSMANNSMVLSILWTMNDKFLFKGCFHSFLKWFSFIVVSSFSSDCVFGFFSFAQFPAPAHPFIVDENFEKMNEPFVLSVRTTPWLAFTILIKLIHVRWLIVDRIPTLLNSSSPPLLVLIWMESTLYLARFWKDIRWFVKWSTPWRTLKIGTSSI